MKQLLLFFIFALISIISFGQHTVSGIVTDDKGDALPGVIIKVKGTDNKVLTDINGRYEIPIKNTSDTLIFAGFTMVDREVPINGQSEINTFLKPYTIFEAWDQKLGFYINSGIINNPYGIRLDFKIPFFKTPSSLQTIFDYQTDLSLNRLIEGSFIINNIRLNRKLRLSLISNFRNVSFDDNYKQDYFSFEANWRLNWNNFITGIGHINLSNKKHNISNNSYGFITGIKFWLPGPVSIDIIGKVGIYKGLTECYIEAYKNFKRIETFIRYYNTKFYSELSIGVGIELYYFFWYQKRANEY